VRKYDSFNDETSSVQDVLDWIEQFYVPTNTV